MDKVWIDENIKNPDKNGVYLCQVKWHNESKYNPVLLEFKNMGWDVSESCEHLYWTKIPPFKNR